MTTQHVTLGDDARRFVEELVASGQFEDAASVVDFALLSLKRHGGLSDLGLPRDEISAERAAEILGLSRSTVEQLIDEGDLAAHHPGADCQTVRLADVLAYREELRARRNDFITESSAAYADSDPAEVAALLAEQRD
ncbi:helix-turn-helix transcriptional regulator [Nocardioides sp.]|uniref:helix-turn-helix transcriptional regulator n=1 Tax=Nocardioides sp. TaxID=35761 RepID=UPI0039E2F9B2